MIFPVMSGSSNTRNSYLHLPLPNNKDIVIILCLYFHIYNTNVKLIISVSGEEKSTYTK